MVDDHSDELGTALQGVRRDLRSIVNPQSSNTAIEEALHRHPGWPIVRVVPMPVLIAFVKDGVPGDAANLVSQVLPGIRRDLRSIATSRSADASIEEAIRRHPHWPQVSSTDMSVLVAYVRSESALPEL